MSDNFNNFIKHLKPRKNSRYHQGIVPERLCRKYADSCRNEPIIFRSGLELQFIEYCENNPNIVRWASEPIQIRYFSRLYNKEKNYYPDYVIENKNETKCIVEVKPYQQTQKPNSMDSKWLKESWIINCDKWTAAKKYAEEHGAKFIIVTEKFFE